MNYVMASKKAPLSGNYKYAHMKGTSSLVQFYEQSLGLAIRVDCMMVGSFSESAALSLVLTFLWLTATVSSQSQQPQVPCFFIFGDSLVDNGNNNGILTLARANYMPYGIDFPQGITGRFTNGKTFVDVLGKTSLYFQLA